MSEIYETQISPKHELAGTRTLKSLIKRTEGMLTTLKYYKKNNIKYSNWDHVHAFFTTDKNLAKKLKFRLSKEYESE